MRMLDGQDITMLEVAWKAQVVSQTHALPRQSNNIGQKLVEEVLLLMNCMSGKEQDIGDLEQKLSLPDVYVLLSSSKLNRMYDDLQLLRSALNHKVRLLGINNKKELERLRKSAYLHHHMNARVFKERI
ncbi:hypothetical protein JVU11DRAFT_11924 [Chiua virens]|nr:hypothetical protein JVU11DRAFT_11924 [Chiua virens]